MSDSFRKSHNSKKNKTTGSIHKHKELYHSSSQHLIDNNTKKERSYLLPSNLQNKDSKLILPKLNSSGYRNYKYKNDYSKKSSLNSKYIKNTKGIKEYSSKPYYYKLNRNGSKTIFDAKKKLSGILDDKINSALGNKKIRDERDKRSILLKMRRRIDDELKRDRTFEDLRFLKDYDDLDEKRKNIKLMRQNMFRDLQDGVYDDFDETFLIPPIPRLTPPTFLGNPYATFIPPPQIIIPPMNNNGNNNNNTSTDTTGDLVKFLLIKKLLERDKQPLFPYPYFPTWLNPYLFPPYPIYKLKRSKRKKNQNYFPKPIVVQSASKEDQNKDNKNTTSTETEKGIPFVDPLENYLVLINRFKKNPDRNSKRSIIPVKKEEPKEEKSSKKNSSKDGEGGEEGGDDEGGDENGGDDGEGGEEGGDDEGGEENGGDEGDGGEGGEDGGEDGGEEGGDEGGEGGEKNVGEGGEEG